MIWALLMVMAQEVPSTETSLPDNISHDLVGPPLPPGWTETSTDDTGTSAEQPAEKAEEEVARTTPTDPHLHAAKLIEEATEQAKQTTDTLDALIQALETKAQQEGLPLPKESPVHPPEEDAPKTLPEDISEQP